MFPFPLTTSHGNKEIVLVFSGGFKDGERLSSNSPDDDEVQLVFGHYLGTNNGEVGRGFRCYSDTGLAELHEITETGEDGGPPFKREPQHDRNHLYRVVERAEDDKTITVRFQYMGTTGQPTPREAR